MNQYTCQSKLHLLILVKEAWLVVTSGFRRHNLEDKDFCASLSVPFSFMPVFGVLLLTRSNVFKKLLKTILKNQFINNLRGLKKLWY